MPQCITVETDARVKPSPCFERQKPMAQINQTRHQAHLQSREDPLTRTGRLMCGPLSLDGKALEHVLRTSKVCLRVSVALCNQIGFT